MNCRVNWLISGNCHFLFHDPTSIYCHKITLTNSSTVTYMQQNKRLPQWQVDKGAHRNTCQLIILKRNYSVDTTRNSYWQHTRCDQTHQQCILQPRTWSSRGGGTNAKIGICTAVKVPAMILVNLFPSSVKFLCAQTCTTHRYQLLVYTSVLFNWHHYTHAWHMWTDCKSRKYVHAKNSYMWTDQTLLLKKIEVKANTYRSKLWLHL